MQFEQKNNEKIGYQYERNNNYEQNDNEKINEGDYSIDDDN